MLCALLLLAVQARHAEDFESRVGLDRFADGWERVAGPGHPGWNEIARVDDGSGGHALRLSTLGSAVAVRRSAADAWAVDPARPWRLGARIRLSGVKRNVATLGLRWLDRRGELLREDASEPLGTADAWTPHVLDVPFPPAEAAAAQPVLRYGGPDVRGEAFFDDVVFEASTLLRVEPADGGAAVFPAGARPRLRVTAFGLGAGQHVLLLRGAAVVGPLPVAPGAPQVIELPALAAGCHEIRAAVEGGDGLVATAVATLAVLPPPSPPGPRRWIGATFNPFHGDLPDPAALARLGGFDRLRLILADASPAGRTPPTDARLAEIVRALAAIDGLELTGVLPQPGALKAWAARTAGGVDAWEIPGPSGPLRIDADDLAAVAAVPATAPLVLPATGSTAEFTRRLIALAASEDRPPHLAVPLDAPLTALAAVRVVNELLSDAEPRPTADLLPAVHEIGFERNGRRCLALWSDVPAVHALELGPGVRIVHPLGEPRLLARGERLAVGPMPVFLDGLDPAALEFRSALRLDDPRVWLRGTPTPRTLTYRNGSMAVENARLRLETPPGWDVKPSEAVLGDLAPGQTATVALSLRPPADAAAATADVPLELSFRQGAVERRLQGSVELQAHSPIGVDVQVEGPRVVVRITHRGEKAAALLARVRLPGRAEQTEVVGRLDPGATKTYDYRLDAPPARIEVDVDEHGGERAWARIVHGR